MAEDRKEAVILVRVDNMDSLKTIGQRSVRFELPADGDQDLDALMERALNEAPPIDEWQAS